MSFQNKSRSTFCDVCHEEIGSEDLIHFIDGFVVCPECFFDFVFEYFQDQMMTVAEMYELIKNDSDT